MIRELKGFRKFSQAIKKMSSPIVLKTPTIAARAGSKASEYGRFLREFIQHPTTTGAVAPSSPALSYAMLRPIDFSRVRLIAELGPGTGSFTKHIMSQRRNHTNFVALETNPAFINSLAKEWGPSSFVYRSAGELRQALDEKGFDQAGAIVSGLPWASFHSELQKSILRQVSACLAPEGIFVTFAYLQGLLLPGGIRFRRLLRQQFTSVKRTRIVWKNLPPAVVYICGNRGKMGGRR